MKVRNLRGAVILSALVLSLCVRSLAPAFGAGVVVPSLELYTWGRLESGVFGFDTRGDMDLQIDGGYKFAGRVLFGFASSTLETAALNDMLTFTSARIILRELFGIPLDFTYFVGRAAAFGSGALFPEQFGAPPLGSRFQSFLHFPGGDFTYDGIYSPSGTGVELAFSPGKGRTLLSMYLYQDSSIDADSTPTTLDWGHFATDFRAALNLDRIKLEAFVGATYPVPDGTLGYYRGGLLFYAAEQGVEFLAQLGVPHWNPSMDPMNIDLFYLFVEPRVRFGAFAVIPSFFWRPGYYQNQTTGILTDTGEQAFDVNLDLRVERPGQWPVGGGIEGNFVYQTEKAGATVNDILVKVSPYLRLLTLGVSWELRVTTNLYPLLAADPAQVFLAVDAEF